MAALGDNPPRLSDRPLTDRLQGRRSERRADLSSSDFVMVDAFSGTKSMAMSAQAMYRTWALTVDVDEAFAPDVLVDFTEWDMFGHFIDELSFVDCAGRHMVWLPLHFHLSPSCTTFSCGSGWLSGRSRRSPFADGRATPAAHNADACVHDTVSLVRLLRRHNCVSTFSIENPGGSFLWRALEILLGADLDGGNSADTEEGHSGADSDPGFVEFGCYSAEEDSDEAGTPADMGEDHSGAEYDLGFVEVGGYRAEDSDETDNGAESDAGLAGVGGCSTGDGDEADNCADMEEDHSGADSDPGFVEFGCYSAEDSGEAGNATDGEQRVPDFGMEASAGLGYADVGSAADTARPREHPAPGGRREDSPLLVRTVVHYCAYGSRFRKPTVIAHSPCLGARWARTCDRSGACGAMRHMGGAFVHGSPGGFSLADAGIPRMLCDGLNLAWRAFHVPLRAADPTYGAVTVVAARTLQKEWLGRPRHVREPAAAHSDWPAAERPRSDSDES